MFVSKEAKRASIALRSILPQHAMSRVRTPRNIPIATIATTAASFFPAVERKTISLWIHDIPCKLSPPSLPTFSKGDSEAAYSEANGAKKYWTDALARVTGARQSNFNNHIDTQSMQPPSSQSTMGSFQWGPGGA